MPVVLLAGLLTLCAAAEQAEIPPERPVDRAKSGRDRAPIVRAPLVDTPPVLDGDLSDPCWQQAYHSDEFWNCNDDREPDQYSEIWVCVDADHLYVASYSHDTEPDEIHYEEKKRNGNIWRDDYISIYVDPTYSLGRTYGFYVTPRGTMKEYIPGGSDAKIEWRGDWRAAGSLVQDGWTAEVAVPWKILHYPSGQSQISLVIGRYIPRTGEATYWPDMGEGYDSKEQARIVGLQMPTVKRPVIVMPNLQAEWTEEHIRNNVGLDLKHTFDNGLTAVATWAPDFRNIEDEVESIDFSYFERYYRDRRPFFTTGEGFLPGSNIFYSRRIEDLDFGLKVFGRLNRTNVGLLQTFTFGQRSDLATEVSHEINDKWGSMAQYVRRDVDGEPLNEALGLRLSRYEDKGFGGFWTSVNYVGTETSGAPHGNTWSCHVDRWYGNGRWGWWGGYRAVSSDYNPQNGFQPEVDWRGPYFGCNLYDKPQDSWIKSYGANINWQRRKHYDGSLYRDDLHLSTHLARKDQNDGFNFYIGWTEIPPHYDQTTSLGYSWGQDQLHKGGYVSYALGDRASADYTRYSARWAWEFKEDFYGDLNYERRISDFWDPATADEDVDRLTLRLNYDFDAEHGCGFCMRSGTDGTNIFITYREAVRVGEDWFIIIGDPNTDKTQPRIAFKTKWVRRW